MSTDVVPNSVVPSTLTVYEKNKLNNKLKLTLKTNDDSTKNGQHRLRPKMSTAKADKLRQILKTRIPERPIIIDENQGLIGPTSLKVDPVESIISNLSVLSRGLRNRIIKEYLNNSPIAYTLTCPHPSGYYRTVPCNYCSHGNPHVVRIEKLTRYFICKFREYKQQFRPNNHSKNKYRSNKVKNAVPPELSIHNDDVEEAVYGTIPSVIDDAQQLISVVQHIEVNEPTAESLVKNVEEAPKTNVIVKTCTASGNDHTSDHSSCNNEPLENQEYLKSMVCTFGIINVECPAQDTYQLGDKYNQFYKANAMNRVHYRTYTVLTLVANS
ncbi:unnamed protein product [Rotaria magnacalcarata]|uniref:Uncharacterized protein n=1 Tax=Rotaria magnacalcarata TaxID=392030 RepID=A0A819SKW9_9BILA|nr:unnamed protein product [Rotaria magnacalcarata]